MTNTFLERQAEAERLWKFVLGDVAPPPNLTWVRWLSTSTDREIEKAIMQIPCRYQKGMPPAEEIYKFMSSLLSVWRKRRLSVRGSALLQNLSEGQLQKFRETFTGDEDEDSEDRPNGDE